MVDTRDFEEMEHVGWNNPVIAGGYASGFEYATKVVARHLCDGAGVVSGHRVLDLCCGHGVVASELVKRGASVTGLDFSGAMIALARKAVPAANFVQGDAMQIDCESDQFDAVTVGFGIPHLPDPARGFGEIARVLKPGGRLSFSIWEGKGSQGSFGWMFDIVGRLGDPKHKLPAGPDAHMFVDETVAETFLVDAGFSNVRVERVASKLEFSAPEDLFDIFDKGAVRMASLLGRQPDNIRDDMREALAKRVRAEGVKTEEGHRVPAPSVVVSAVLN